MKAILQRVSEASVTISNNATGDETVAGAIGPGLLILICAEEGDGTEEVDFFARKIARMRIFTDEAGKMNRALLDTDGAALVVSQFTLAADWRKGNRPSFTKAAPPEEGERLYKLFCDKLRAEGITVETGVFGAKMAVRLLNDGPVTIPMDSKV